MDPVRINQECNNPILCVSDLKKTDDKKTHWKGIEHFLKAKKEMATNSDKIEENGSDVEKLPTTTKETTDSDENLIGDVSW